MPRSVGDTNITPLRYIPWMFWSARASPETRLVPELSPIRNLGEAHLFLRVKKVLIHSARYLTSSFTPKNFDPGVFLSTILEYPVFTGSTYTISATSRIEFLFSLMP